MTNKQKKYHDMALKIFEVIKENAEADKGDDWRLVQNLSEAFSRLYDKAGNPDDLMEMNAKMSLISKYGFSNGFELPKKIDPYDFQCELCYKEKKKNNEGVTLFCEKQHEPQCFIVNDKIERIISIEGMI